MEPTTPFLRPTALQQMRGFLAESGANLPPWSPSDEVLDELVALFHERRDDAEFFARLTPFLASLKQSAARGESGLPAKDAEVLTQSTVEALIEELRASLRAAPQGASRSMLRSLLGNRSAALLSLALLGIGVSGCSGCKGSAPPPPPQQHPKPTTPPRPLPIQRPSERAGVAEPSGPQKAGTPDQLVEMFKQKTPEQAAKELEKAFDASTPDKPAPAPADMPKYKGVCF